MAERWQEIEGDLWTEVEDAAVNAGRDEFGVDASDIVEPACKRIAALEAEVERLREKVEGDKQELIRRFDRIHGLEEMLGSLSDEMADHARNTAGTVSTWTVKEWAATLRKALEGDA